jgi:hypothetical protein
MNIATVFFLDGTSTTFGAPTVTLNDGQFWLEILNGQGEQVALIPREQIKYVATPFNTAA